tara:strand:- start:174466 stop:174708 length:243 start_codon:yes stop_codon:yes gene_type:complete
MRVILLNEHHSRDSVYSGLPQTGDLSYLSGLSSLIEYAFCLTVLTGSLRDKCGRVSLMAGIACLKLVLAQGTVMSIVSFQ